MPDISLTQTAAMPPDVAFEKLRQAAERFSELKKLDDELTLQFDETQLKAFGQGREVNFQLSVESDPEGARIQVRVKFPFFMLPWRGEVERAVKDRLAQVFQAPHV